MLLTHNPSLKYDTVKLQNGFRHSAILEKKTATGFVGTLRTAVS